jgi:hypothetical protein
MILNRQKAKARSASTRATHRKGRKLEAFSGTGATRGSSLAIHARRVSNRGRMVSKAVTGFTPSTVSPRQAEANLNWKLSVYPFDCSHQVE